MKAAGILVRARATRRVLLLKDAGTGLWVAPGGAIERGEDALQAATRELVEETGYNGYVAVDEHACELNGYVLFRGTVPREFFVWLSHEHVDSTWADSRRLPRPLHPGLEELLSCR